MIKLKYFEGTKKDFLSQITNNQGSNNQKLIWIATVNPEFIMEAGRDKRFANILQNKTDFNVIDGKGILWQRAIKKTPNFKFLIFKKIQLLVQVFFLRKDTEYLIAGVDLMDDLCRLSVKFGLQVNFIGGFDGAAEKTAKYFEEKYKIKYKTFGEPGQYLKFKKENLKNFNNKAITFVALGMKKQEFWIEENIKNIPAGIVVGVGRSFDYYSGQVKRAGLLWRKLGLEWFYSALMDPKRARRQLANLPRFFWEVLLG